MRFHRGVMRERGWFVDAGFDEVALVQIGADQQKPFFEWAEKELLPALREL
jgi:hypothetical protein